MDSGSLICGRYGWRSCIGGSYACKDHMLSWQVTEQGLAIGLAHETGSSTQYNSHVEVQEAGQWLSRLLMDHACLACGRCGRRSRVGRRMCM